MKRIVILTIILIGTCFAQAQENQVFYYGKNIKKIYLDKIENKKIIHFSKTIERSQKENICNRLRIAGFTVEEIMPFMYDVYGESIQQRGIDILSTAVAKGDVSYVSDLLMYKKSSIQWSSNKIFLKINPNSDLRNILKQSKIPAVDFKQFGTDKETYLVELDVAENSALYYANRLSESGNIIWSQPSFWKFIRKHNPYYPLQWGLNNTGQYGDSIGIDINAINAWSIATGSGVKVAVIDEGVDLTHPDLVNNLLEGYDATDAACGGSYGGYGGCGREVDDAHGTACAGIIAAEDNNIGVKGVAYNAQIIPVRIAYNVHYCCGHPCWIEWPEYLNLTRVQCFDGWLSNDEWIADGIRKAWDDYGADILSNSWGGDSESEAIEAEINAAVTQGRNSLGSVVVFSAGNDFYEGGIAYPAYLPNVIAVGAITPTGQRADFSNYGSADLDIVAPGILIPTTDIQGSLGYNPKFYFSDLPDQDYTAKFNGTSSACPHVAGVAALVLSVNPNLNAQQVRNIIESTAQPIGGYNYQIDPNRPGWNDEMGYGLVDAYEALKKAVTLQCVYDFSNQTVSSNTIVFGCDSINVQNVTVNATLTIKSLGKITIQNNVTVNSIGSLILETLGHGRVVIDDKFDLSTGGFEIK